MKKYIKRSISSLLALMLVLSVSGCGAEKNNSPPETGSGAASTSPAEESDQPVTIKITWWGSQTRHDQTQQVLDLYTELHPNVTFEVMPSGWDGYFDKLSTQTASGSMPDIVQMDYLYITTYTKNQSVADLQPFLDDGTIDVSNIDENLINTGRIDGKLSGMILASSLLGVGYNPEVFAEAGVSEPTCNWTWSDYLEINNQILKKTGKYGTSVDPTLDTNILNYWIRQHGAALFSADKKSLGYGDDKIVADYFAMWKALMDGDQMPNPDEFEQISTLGMEAGPVVTGDAGMIFEWNNYASKVSANNDKIKVATPPLADNTTEKGLWLKPGMFFSIADTSNVKKEAAQFINWFINSKEANDIMMAERGTPVSSEIREHLLGAGKLAQQQRDMFRYVDEAMPLCGDTPDPDPVGMSEVNAAFKNAAAKAFYGQLSNNEAAAAFREEANTILERNN